MRLPKKRAAAGVHDQEGEEGIPTKQHNDLTQRLKRLWFRSKQKDEACEPKQKDSKPIRKNR